MTRVRQIELTLPSIGEMEPIDDWTFNGAPTRELTHCYHDYPARMIPQVAGKLLDTFGQGAELLFDPYCGTGTSMVEALIRNINAAGTDLNPLARLISQAKTTLINKRVLKTELRTFYNHLTSARSRSYRNAPSEILGVTRLDFWFKPKVIAKLAYIDKFIKRIKNQKVKLFFQVAFSETVRESSNTRTAEFKLYRYDPKRLNRFNPDVFGIMCHKLERNRKGFENFLTFMNQFATKPRAKIHHFNTVEGMPSRSFKPRSIDIVITSPPYGDSHTTVAYGQYSRLSSAWLALEEPHKVDSALMGGKIYKEMTSFPSAVLNDALTKITQQNRKRGLEVASFYLDLQRSITNIVPFIRSGGHACYVVGNRKVKGIVLPTHDAIKCFFQEHGFEHIHTFNRSIPNKRMPLKNSPTNVAGVHDATMTREYIVVMRRT